MSKVPDLKIKMAVSLPTKSIGILSGDGSSKYKPVLRYEKRTYTYRKASVPEGKNITPEEVVVEDAIPANQLAASLNGNTDETPLTRTYQQIKATAPKAYWEYLDNYAPVMTAYSLTIPMLFLQGERDYQVTMQDFAMWKLGMYGKTNVTFKSYPTLNHCFIEGTGKSTPMEYNHPAQVSKEVMKDIAKWVIQK